MENTYGVWSAVAQSSANATFSSPRGVPCVDHSVFFPHRVECPAWTTPVFFLMLAVSCVAQKSTSMTNGRKTLDGVGTHICIIHTQLSLTLL